MVKAMFGKPVKYKGNRYPAYTEFEVLKKDLKEVTSAGGWVVEEPEVKTTGEDIKDTDDNSQEVKENEQTTDGDGA